jgi:hypothetical protein
MTPDNLGLVIGAVFGLIYVVANAGALPSPAGPVLSGLAAAVFVAVLVLLGRARTGAGPDATPEGGFGRDYWLVVAAEVVAAAAGIVALRGPLDLPEGVLPWISFVVGVHFFGLARVWAEPSLGWVGAGIAVLGVVGLVVAAAGASDASIAAIAGVGPGALLLGGSLWGADRRRRGSPPGDP